MEISEIGKVIDKMISDSEKEQNRLEKWLLKNITTSVPETIISTSHKIMREINRQSCLYELKGKAGI